MLSNHTIFLTSPKFFLSFILSNIAKVWKRNEMNKDMGWVWTWVTSECIMKNVFRVFSQFSVNLQIFLFLHMREKGCKIERHSISLNGYIIMNFSFSREYGDTKWQTFHSQLAWNYDNQQQKGYTGCAKWRLYPIHWLSR